MIRSVAVLAPRTARPRNLRAIRDEHIAVARERIFGFQDNMPGDRQFRKKLEGKKLMRWYFPSKYAVQDFRVDEYFEMQAERFQPREPHDSRRELTGITRKVSKHREELRQFFQQLDRQEFLDSPELQDLYGVFRLVDPDTALPFQVPDLVFKEHGPMFSADAPFQTAGGRADVDDQQLALQALVLEALGGEGSQARALELSAQLSLLRSPEEVREALLLKAKEHNVVPSFERMAVVVEESEEAKLERLLQKAKAAAPPEVAAGESGNGADDGNPDATLLAEVQGTSEEVKEEASLDPDLSKALGELQGKSEEGLNPASGQRRRILGFHAQPTEPAKGETTADIEKMRARGPKPLRAYVKRRHRFMDPMYRRRRLKWLERALSGEHKEKELKFNSYYATHPDDHPVFPTNKGSVTVVWPSPYH